MVKFCGTSPAAQVGSKEEGICRPAKLKVSRSLPSGAMPFISAPKPNCFTANWPKGEAMVRSSSELVPERLVNSGNAARSLSLNSACASMNASLS